MKEILIEQKPLPNGKITVLLFALAISFLWGIYLIGRQEKLQEKAIGLFHKSDVNFSFQNIGPDALADHNSKLEKSIENTSVQLKKLLPTAPYIVVNTTGNDFKLYNNRHEIIREGLVSTGSFTILKAGNDKAWMFKTPRGQLKVLGKTKDPVWKRPDWAFIEEGLKVPSHNHPSRYEYGTLGDYSLNLGNGYLIHGTLYQRFLGLPVTHGCIRMGDDDLELVFKTLQIGSRVYIY
jgi:L,D-transpeptidase ErfK/SrfK